jgi:hypothetical protein
MILEVKVIEHELNYTDSLNLIFLLKYQAVHVRWVPWHHSMACPRVADGGMASSYGR